MWNLPGLASADIRKAIKNSEHSICILDYDMKLSHIPVQSDLWMAPAGSAIHGEISGISS